MLADREPGATGHDAAGRFATDRTGGVQQGRHSEGEDAMRREAGIQVHTYREHRNEVRDDGGDGWAVVVHPRLGDRGAPETLRSGTLNGLADLLAQARRWVDRRSDAGSGRASHLTEPPRAGRPERRGANATEWGSGGDRARTRPVLSQAGVRVDGRDVRFDGWPGEPSRICRSEFGGHRTHHEGQGLGGGEADPVRSLHRLAMDTLNKGPVLRSKIVLPQQDKA